MIWAMQCRWAMHVGQRGSCPFPTHLTTKEEIDRYEERLVTTLDKLKANEWIRTMFSVIRCWDYIILRITEWERCTWKYLAGGYDAWTSLRSVQMLWPRAIYFPVQPSLSQSMWIQFLYDHPNFSVFPSQILLIYQLISWFLSLCAHFQRATDNIWVIQLTVGIIERS